jgi:hypothetical protein
MNYWYLKLPAWISAYVETLEKLNRLGKIFLAMVPHTERGFAVENALVFRLEFWSWFCIRVFQSAHEKYPVDSVSRDPRMVAEGL